MYGISQPEIIGHLLLYFCGQLVVSVILTSRSKTCKSFQVGVEVQSPYIIERCSTNVCQCDNRLGLVFEATMIMSTSFHLQRIQCH